MKSLKFIFFFVLSTHLAFAMQTRSPRFEYCKAEKIALNDQVYIRFGNEYVSGVVTLIQDRELGKERITQYGVTWFNVKLGNFVFALINRNCIYKKQRSKYYT